MVYTPIIGSLGYILSKDRAKVLMVHRTHRESDDHLGKYNGLGGKMEPNEDIVSCMKREIREEAGIECTQMRLRGTINWTGFGKRGEDWLGFIFLIEQFEGEPKTSNHEGPLIWVEREEMDQLPMWEGDRFFLPMVFDGDPRLFHGFMPYKDGKPQSWTLERV